MKDKPIGYVHRGYWCPACLQFVYAEEGTLPEFIRATYRCGCIPWSQKEYDNLKANWLPVFSKPVRRGK